MGEPGRRRVIARKRFAQHFLEPAWVDKLMAVVTPLPTDAFLEIGPGRGALTLPLAARAGRVVAVEIDRDLAAGLGPRLPANVQLLNQNFLTVDADEIAARLDGPFRRRVAANLPYNVAIPVLFRLLALARGGEGFTDATVMLQQEVAERLTARPGTKPYGVLSIVTRVHADTTRLLTLPPGAFRPAPKVTSAVVRLSFREAVPTGPDPAVFERLVRDVFTRRRKTMLNALKPLADQMGTSSSETLEAAGIDPSRRPETLEVTDFAALAEFLTSRRE